MISEQAQLEAFAQARQARLQISFLIVCFWCSHNSTFCLSIARPLTCKSYESALDEIECEPFAPPLHCTGMTDLEDVRQLAIAQYQLDEEGPEPELDSITQMTAELFDVPISAVTVLSRDRQIFQSACGLGADGSPRSDAFCNFTIEEDEVFVVEDAQADPRFCDNPLVTGEPYIRFYAGAPIRVGSEVPIGALCVIDQSPRRFSEKDARRLSLLAHTVSGIMELRIGSRLRGQRESELRAQTELLRATVDNVQQGIAVFNAASVLILSNERLFQLMGLKVADWPAGETQLHELLSAAAKGGWESSSNSERLTASLLSPSLKSDEPSRFELCGGDGKIFEVWHSAIPGKHSILTVHDVTERRQVVRMKDEFVSTVSHELRTPLTSIRGALLVLNKTSGEALDEKGKKMLEMASRNAVRLAELVNDILDIEKLGSGALTMHSEQIDLAQVLREVCEQLRPLAVSHEVEIALTTDEFLPVRGDTGRLAQALSNLLSNAFKFSPAGATVEVTGQHEDGQVKVSVADRGPGIPPDFRSQIFRRFAQADPSHRSGITGTGLGLAITKAIIDQHQGEIGYESQPAQGACFWFTLSSSSEEEVA
ncbi:GAF domain-containing sensor histidine kinase [Alteripontixanthobacter muriae]|uniref:GAF domain-containing sensor histidine kinase n=1 Tax=Alteripontixanthobacter muriae TaxID=2705546 RepID=UPI001E60CD66|nr:ATP-binding protein [Alteripontixanthobacter muriae]